MLPYLDFVSTFITSDFANSNNKEAIYRGFKFSYNYNKDQFIIRLEKDNIAINLPFALSQSPSECNQYVKGLIDFIVSQTENSLNKAIILIENSNIKFKEMVKENKKITPITKSSYDENYNCFSHLAEDYEEEDTHPNVQESNDLKDWFNSTDTTRFLK